MNVPAAVFGFLIASAGGLSYHLIRGGPLSRLLLYLASSWIGFGIGHFVGGWLDLSLLRVGALNLFPALLAGLLALLLTDVLAPPQSDSSNKRRPDPPLTPRG